jgi:chaperonin cofactor prefoldin
MYSDDARTQEPLEIPTSVNSVPLEPSIAPARSESGTSPTAQPGDLERRVATLQQQERELKAQIKSLQAVAKQLQEQNAETQATIGRMVQEGLRELEQRKQTLQVTVEQLERRQERVRAEMRTSFAGVSQDLAIRVQSFKDYLVGSLQDLATAAEQLDLPKATAAPEKVVAPISETKVESQPATPNFAEQSFQDQTRQIRKLLDQYRNRPDYYGPAWQLRRTFEPVHAERVSNWFFTQGGRGAIRTMGSRLQNILVASAAISVLHELYDDRLRALVLAQTPERLGEWRRGLQDCLGIARTDFTPERGVALFEAPEPLTLKADRLVKDGKLPLIIIDDTEDQVNLSILQFPLWLAFAPNPEAPSMSNYSY